MTNEEIIALVERETARILSEAKMAPGPGVDFYSGAEKWNRITRERDTLLSDNKKLADQLEQALGFNPQRALLSIDELNEQLKTTNAKLTNRDDKAIVDMSLIARIKELTTKNEKEAVRGFAAGLDAAADFVLTQPGYTTYPDTLPAKIRALKNTP